MRDILPFVASLLSSIDAQIELSYRDTDVTFPLIVLSTVSDMAETSRDGDEVVTNMNVQVDVYTLDKDTTYTTAKTVDSLLMPAGLRRMNAFAVTEGDMERYQMTYTANIDWDGKTIL